VKKRDLAIRVVEKLGHSHNEVSAIVQATLDEVAKALAEGQRLEIRNFGVFEVKRRQPRRGRNPRTGAEVRIPEKRVVAFKPGKALREFLESRVAPSAEAENEVPGGAGEDYS